MYICVPVHINDALRDRHRGRGLNSVNNGYLWKEEMWIAFFLYAYPGSPHFPQFPHASSKPRKTGYDCQHPLLSRLDGRAVADSSQWRTLKAALGLTVTQRQQLSSSTGTGGERGLHQAQRRTFAKTEAGRRFWVTGSLYLTWRAVWIIAFLAVCV